MARIVILEHPWQRRHRLAYLLYELAPLWEQAGHQVLLHDGFAAPPAGDLAILHVDLSVVPQEFAALVRRYPRVVNAAALDITKRRVGALGGHGLPDAGAALAWGGPVIVKSDANFGGLAERLAAQTEGRVAPAPVGLDEYRVFDRAADLPAHVWQRPDWVVERFVPERDAASGAYAVRIWTFFGRAERCTRYLGDAPVVKGEAMRPAGPCPVPEPLRAARAALGFDFGKFDFVVHQGQPILLDANRTPVAPTTPAVRSALAASNAELAAAVDEFLPVVPRRPA